MVKEDLMWKRYKYMILSFFFVVGIFVVGVKLPDFVSATGTDKTDKVRGSLSMSFYNGSSSLYNENSQIIDMSEAIRAEIEFSVKFNGSSDPTEHIGADDYVVKPFSPRELMLRINAILQRTKRSVFYTPELYAKDVLVFPGLIIDVNSHKVIVDDTEVLLTPKEFDLLLFLAKSPDKAFKRNEILRAVWDYDFYSDLRTVDTHIKRVRKKFDKISPIVAQMIVTVWGIGYKFDTSQNSL